MARLGFPTRQTCIAAAVFCLAASAHAQNAADAAAVARQADILQRQQQERIQRDIEKARPRDLQPGIDTQGLIPKVDASAAGKKCHDIRTISITGAALLSASVRADVLRRYSGRCLGVAEIEQILAALTKDYITRGYITTRAYLPSQDLSRGTLEIVVLEGVVESIILDPGAQRSIRPGTVFPGPGAKLNLRDFEQGIDQVNRLASNNARLDFQPGEAAGASRVMIYNTPRLPVHAGMSADNHGSEGTGKNQLGTSLSGDRLLGMNELVLYTYRRSQPNDMERKGSASHSLTVIAPLGYSTMSYSGSRANFVSMLAAPSGQALQFRGESRSDAWKFERLVYRDQATRETLSATLTMKESKNYLADQFLGVSSRALSVLDLDSSTSTALLGGAISVDLGYARGLRVGGALRDIDGLPDDAPRAQFGKFKAGLGYIRPFAVAGTPALFSSQFVSQYAQRTLYGSEQILIGGLYSVRGFVNNTLSGDHGWYSRNELSLRPTLSLAGRVFPLRVYAGLDFGRVKNRAADIPQGSLSGMVAGLSASWKGVSADLSVTRALRQPDFFARESAQAWVRLNVDL